MHETCQIRETKDLPGVWQVCHCVESCVSVSRSSLPSRHHGCRETSGGLTTVIFVLNHRRVLTLRGVSQRVLLLLLLLACHHQGGHEALPHPRHVHHGSRKRQEMADATKQPKHRHGIALHLHVRFASSTVESHRGGRSSSTSAHFSPRPPLPPPRETRPRLPMPLPRAMAAISPLRSLQGAG